MDALTEKRLARLKHYATRYEVVATKGGQSILLCYTSRKSRNGMFAAITEKDRVQHIVALTGSESIQFAKKTSDGGTMGDWRIHWGRTQREAILGGEHPYVGDVAKES